VRLCWHLLCSLRLVLSLLGAAPGREKLLPYAQSC
jgi:hypothetical protein